MGFDKDCLMAGTCSVSDAMKCDPLSIGCKAVAAGCYHRTVGDGICHEACNTADFNYDGGDCEPSMPAQQNRRIPASQNSSGDVFRSETMRKDN